MDYRNAKRLLDGYIEDTRGIAFSAYTSLTRGASRHGGGADWKDGKRIRTRVPSKDRVKVARNTWLERGWSFDISSVAGHGRAAGSIRSGDKLRYPENSIGVRFHDTYIVILTPHWTELNTGGWATMSTRERMESFSPVRISADRNGWALYLDGEDWASGGHPYFDGIRVSSDGKRMMRSQPNRPREFEPVKTVSGWTGESNRGRRAHEPFWTGPEPDPMVGRVNYDPVRGA